MSVELNVMDRSDGDFPQLRPGFPLRPGKTQRPLVHGDTLRRDRLFDWLQGRGDRRVLFVVAEAGFGKTTLMADYLRRSRMRAFWYRLDQEETDGLVFIRYIVAACQAVDQRLLYRTSALLNETSLEPTRQAPILETLLAEMDCLGEIPSALVLDDFHMSESIPEIARIADRLIERAPRGLRFMLMSRRTPSLSVAAMRARGELAQLGREELRFDESETSRLFSDAYRQPLETDVLHDLQLRTDGWAASLQLVKTAIDGRTPAEVRDFVQSLSGADGDLYDYLAEEVVGDLPSDLRSFLMRVALLEEIDADAACVAASVASPDARRLLGEGHRLGLLSKGAGLVATWRLHPLVREFLLARLQLDLGKIGIVDLHRHLAIALEPRSWRLAAHHWAAAGDADKVRRAVCSAIPTVIGTGDFATADDLLARFPDPEPNPFYDILHSRQLAAEGRYKDAVELVRRSAPNRGEDNTSDPSLAVASALNALHLGLHINDADMGAAASAALAQSGDDELASIAQSADLLWASRGGGSLAALCGSLVQTAKLNRERGHQRHEGISLVNLSIAESARGHHCAAAEVGQEALRLLETSGDWADVSAAHLNIAKGLAHLGEWADAERHMSAGLAADGHWIEPDVFAEAAELQAMYGDPEKAMALIRSAIAGDAGRADCSYVRQVSARLAMLRGSWDEASQILSSAGSSPIAPGYGSAVQSLRVQIHASAALGDGHFELVSREALAFAHRQQAWFWWKSIRLTQALVSTPGELNNMLAPMDSGAAAHLSIQAELVSRRLSDLAPDSLVVVTSEAHRRPERWRWPLRQILSDASARPSDIRIAAELLEVVGDRSDVSTLRHLARRKTLRMPDAGRLLAKRLASKVYVEDLGRMSLRIGDQLVAGTSIRKKVLSLLTYLLTRPQFSASREQVIDALWPEMEPEAGANSLNQTSYFLRHILEPTAADDTAANLLDSKADLIWLDPELVHSRSSECRGLISVIRRDPSPDLITKLAETYTGRFAVDFIYDDWASGFRDSLHASYLDRVERAIVADTNAGAFERALSVAQLALQADPEAEQIELCLLRLYRRMGATAAAAEQYAHYAGVLRDQLGLEPPPLESI
jgi:LuxR family maltose regulon positive regulatory protein